MTIKEDTLKLELSGRINLWKIDLTPIGGSIYWLCNEVNQFNGNVVWQGQTYTAYPISASGFERSGVGPFPRPRLRVADVDGTIGALIQQYNGLVGGKVTRKQTLVKYLDAANFVGGNPTASAGTYFPDEVYLIDRRAKDDGVVIEFELAASVDVHGVRLPLRQVIQNVCTWTYRSSECGYAGTSYWKADDTPTASPAEDKCSRLMSGCKLRFTNDLPTGAFPTAGLTRV